MRVVGVMLSVGLLLQACGTSGPGQTVTEVDANLPEIPEDPTVFAVGCPNEAGADAEADADGCAPSPPVTTAPPPDDASHQ